MENLSPEDEKYLYSWIGDGEGSKGFLYNWKMVQMVTTM